MSAFDTKVMRWLQTANINGSEKKDVLSNGIGGVDRYMRLETDAAETGITGNVDWSCRERMIQEVQKVDRDLHDDPEINYSEKLTDIQAIMNTLGPNSCGVAWLRSDGTLKLQLSVKKLPFYMVNGMPSPDLPVRVLGLIKLGTLILEYEPSTYGYDAIREHVGYVKEGESVPCPVLKKWPHRLRSYQKREIPSSEPKNYIQNLREATISPSDDSLMRSVGDARWALNSTGRWTLDSSLSPIR